MHKHEGLNFSTRVLTKTLDALLKKNPNATLRDWVNEVETFKGESFKGSQWRETALMVLESLNCSMGKILNFTDKRGVDFILNFDGAVILDCSDLTDDETSLLSEVFYFRCFHSRRLDPSLRQHMLCFLVDDALRIVSRKKDESESPSEEWFRLGREYNLASGISTQFYPGISSVIRSCLDTVIICSASGEESEMLARDLNLTPEQKEFLSTLPPGNCVVISRSVWPYAVLGSFPK